MSDNNHTCHCQEDGSDNNDTCMKNDTRCSFCGQILHRGGHQDTVIANDVNHFRARATTHDSGADCPYGFQSVARRPYNDLLVTVGANVLLADETVKELPPLVPSCPSSPKRKASSSAELELAIAPRSETKHHSVRKGWALQFCTGDLPSRSPYGWLSTCHFVVSRAQLVPTVRRLEAAFQAASVQCEIENCSSSSSSSGSSSSSSGSSSNINDSSSNNTLVARRLHCQTLEQIGFVVSLWDYEAAAANGPMALLEVDCTSGDSIVFYETYVRLIVDAIEGTRPVEPPFTPITASLNAKAESVTEQFMRDMLGSAHPTMTTDPSTAFLFSECNEAKLFDAQMDHIYDTLTSPRYHLQSQALDTLLIMSDSTKTMPKTVTGVCRIIAAGIGNSTGKGMETVPSSPTSRPNRDQTIQQTLLRLAFGNGESTRDGCGDTPKVLSAHAYQALMLLARAVVTVDMNDVIHFIQVTDKVLSPSSGASLVDCLMVWVDDANINPHVAYWATLILVALAKATTIETKRRISVPTIQRAKVVGTCSHAALAHASHELLSQLSTAVIG